MSRVVQTAPRPIWQLAAPLLEGPVWVEREAALWFVDIKSKRIHRFDPASEQKDTWEAPEQVGFILPATRDRFVVGLQTGLALFDPNNITFEHLVDPEPGLPGNRLNDATVDPSGRLWFGTMDDGEREATGRIWLWMGNGGCVAMTTPVPITNGPAVSPDGSTLYYVDTLAGLIHSATIAADGRLVEPRIFATIPNSEGYPDGPSVDAEGCLWVGLYMGYEARRYAPSGQLLERVRFPVSAITKLAFGGPDRRTVFATTAAKHLDQAGRLAEPLAGALFSFDVSVPGLTPDEVLIGNPDLPGP